MIRLVLFDIDGTLIHSDGAGTRAFERAFATLHKISNGSRGMNFAGRTDTGLARELFERHGIEATRKAIHEFFDCYVYWLDHFLQATSKGGIFPGVLRLIDDLRAQPKPPIIGLLTGNIRLGAEIKLRRYDLWEQFEFGAFSDENEDRNQIAVIARQVGVELLNEHLRPDQVLVIGDTPFDIECARAIDARVLAVATGGSTAEALAKHKPDWVVEGLEHITAAEICKPRVIGK